MDALQILPLISRWTHVLLAVIAVGGVFYARVILLPSVRESLDDEQAKALKQAIAGRWRKVVMIAVALLLASGLYNYFAVTRHLHTGQGLYHMLFGIKFLLAMGVFFLASVLSGRTAAFDRMRAGSSLWLGITLTLGIMIVLIAGLMKLLPTTA